MGSSFGKSRCPAAAPGQPENDLYTCHYYGLSVGGAGKAGNTAGERIFPADTLSRRSKTEKGWFTSP